MCAKYAPSLRALREIHCSAGTPIPSLVDVDWRLDYVVKSSKSGPVNQALYVVKLTTAAPGSPGVCSVSPPTLPPPSLPPPRCCPLWRERHRGDWERVCVNGICLRVVALAQSSYFGVCVCLPLAPGPAVLRHVQFTCSPPQLQDLLAKVSDATRAAAAALKDL